MLLKGLECKLHEERLKKFDMLSIEKKIDKVKVGRQRDMGALLAYLK